MPELIELDSGSFEKIKSFFRDVLTKEPWNEDWSDDKQLGDYIKDISGCFNSITYGFFEKGEMIGLSIGNKRHWYGGTEYFIDEFCIKTEYQGKGLGTLFLREIEKAIRKNGMTQIYLQTERGAPAFDFYIKNGFCELTDHASLFKEIV